MKRALTEEQIAEIEARSRAPIEGTYGAMNRTDYPTLKGVSNEAGGFVPDRNWCLEKLREAEDIYLLEPTYTNECRIKCFKMLLPLFIDEIDGEQ